MAEFTQENRHRNHEDYDFEEVSYIHPPEPDSLELKTTPADDEQLGEIRAPDVFQTEHRVYGCPFRYRNVTVENWYEYGVKGIELLADAGAITIVEETPIVSVTVVGTGCSGHNYNICEWWSEGESLRQRSAEDRSPPRLIKRQRVDNLKGQHPAFLQRALAQELPEFESLEEAKGFLRRVQRIVHGMTSNYTMPGSVMSGLYENTAVFRVGDTSRPELTPHRVVIRGGGLDNEDPFDARNRYPADYTFRLIDVVVKKSGGE